MTTFSQINDELRRPPVNYAEAKIQAQKLDELLGYKCQAIEDQLTKPQSAVQKQQFWIGLDLQSLQTPYSEIVEMIEAIDPKNGDLWLDLGAAYGRMGVVLGFLKPEVKFIGYEYVQPRVDEGNRILNQWNLRNSVLQKVDLISPNFELPSADLFFIYDFGSKADVYAVLEKLRKIAAHKSIQVISRGRAVKNWILMDFPWLGGVQAPVHFKNWSLFRS